MSSAAPPGHGGALPPTGKSASGAACDGGADPLEGHHRYRRVQALNSGTFGFVQLALDTHTGQQVAIKFLERGPGISKGVVREVRNHLLVSMHPHVVQFREVFVTRKFLAIAMEYVAGGDLCDYFIEHSLVGTGLPEDLARWFFQQVWCLGRVTTREGPGG